MEARPRPSRFEHSARVSSRSEVPSLNLHLGMKTLGLRLRRWSSGELAARTVQGPEVDGRALRVLDDHLPRDLLPALTGTFATSPYPTVGKSKLPTGPS